MKVTYISCNTK